MTDIYRFLISVAEEQLLTQKTYPKSNNHLLVKGILVILN